MAPPITRYQSKQKEGQFIKGVLEQPPVMDTIIKSLMESTKCTDGCNENIKTTLINLSLILKSPATKDVVKKHLNSIHHVIERQGIFIDKSMMLVITHMKHMSEGEEEGISKSMRDIFEHLIEYKDILNMQQPMFIQLKTAAVAKLYKLNEENANFRNMYGNNYLKHFIK